MKHAALLMLLAFALSSPVMAKPHFHHHFHHHHHSAVRSSHHANGHARASHHADHHTARAAHHVDRHAGAAHPAESDTAHASHSGITCEMVRAYVAKVGMGQAIAMAKSAGITAAEEERARHCLAKKI